MAILQNFSEIGSLAGSAWVLWGDWSTQKKHLHQCKLQYTNQPKSKSIEENIFPNQTNNILTWKLVISYIRSTPSQAVIVTTRIITFLVGNPYKHLSPIGRCGGRPNIPLIESAAPWQGRGKLRTRSLYYLRGFQEILRPFAGKRFLKLLKKFVFVSLGLGDCAYIPRESNTFFFWV